MASQTVIEDPVNSTTKPTDKVTSDHDQKSGEDAPVSKSPTRHPSGSPEPNCAICLGKLENKSFTDSCFHMFCFVCLLEWSKVKAECPLCKQPFKSIVHNVRSYEDYDQYHLEQEQIGEGQDAARFRYRTTMTLERFLQVRQREMQRQRDLLHRPSGTRTQYRTRRQNASAEFRQRVYTEGLHVIAIRGDNMRIRNISPEFFSANPTCSHRLVPWLNRELNALLRNRSEEDRSQFIMELILGLIKRFAINSEEFYQHVVPFIGSRTRHFMREFESFARSPYCMMAYDQHAVYEPYAEHIESDSGDSPQSTDPIVISPEGPTPLIIADEATPTNSPSDPVVIMEEPSLEPVVQTVEPTPLLESDRVQPPVRLASSGWDSPIAGPSWQETPAEESSKSPDPASKSPSVNMDCKIKKEWNDFSDWDSNTSDVIVVGFEKPWHERTPVLVSSDPNEEALVQSHYTRKRKSNKERDSHYSRQRDKQRRRSRERSTTRSHGSNSTRPRYYDNDHHSDRRRYRTPDRRHNLSHDRRRSRTPERRRSRTPDRYRARTPERRRRDYRYDRSRSRERKYGSGSREYRHRRSRSRERDTYRDRYIREPSPSNSTKYYESSKTKNSYASSKSSKSKKRSRHSSSSDDLEIIEDRPSSRGSRKHKKHKKHKHKHGKESKERKRHSPTVSPSRHKKSTTTSKHSSIDKNKNDKTTDSSKCSTDKSGSIHNSKSEVPSTSPSQSDKNLYKKHPTGHKHTKSTSQTVVATCANSSTQHKSQSSLVDGVCESQTPSNKEDKDPRHETDVGSNVSSEVKDDTLHFKCKNDEDSANLVTDQKTVDTHGNKCNSGDVSKHCSKSHSEAAHDSDNKQLIEKHVTEECVADNHCFSEKNSTQPGSKDSRFKTQCELKKNETVGNPLLNNCDSDIRDRSKNNSALKNSEESKNFADSGCDIRMPDNDSKHSCSHYASEIENKNTNLCHVICKSVQLGGTNRESEQSTSLPPNQWSASCDEITENLAASKSDPGDNLDFQFDRKNPSVPENRVEQSQVASSQIIENPCTKNTCIRTDKVQRDLSPISDGSFEEHVSDEDSHVSDEDIQVIDEVSHVSDEVSHVSDEDSHEHSTENTPHESIEVKNTGDGSLNRLNQIASPGVCNTEDKSVISLENIAQSSSSSECSNKTTSELMHSDDVCQLTSKESDCRSTSVKTDSLAHAIKETSSKIKYESSSTEEGEISSSDDESVNVYRTARRVEKEQTSVRQSPEVHEISSGSDVEIDHVDGPTFNAHPFGDSDLGSFMNHHYTYINQYSSSLNNALHMFERIRQNKRSLHNNESVDVDSSSSDELSVVRNVGHKESMVISSDDSEDDLPQSHRGPQPQPSAIHYDTISSETEGSDDESVGEIMYDESLSMRSSNSNREYGDY